ncbi:MAG: hypothetical protein L6M37_01895 [Candidatus Methylarchaceae archaeon HK02M1]|nr:hypothetical protein [Candidatus Methylarchaceae archaeon HK02M1]
MIPIATRPITAKTAISSIHPGPSMRLEFKVKLTATSFELPTPSKALT